MVGTRTIVTASAAVAIVGYLIYFDYKRRNDSEFRKRLRKFEGREFHLVLMIA